MKMGHHEVHQWLLQQIEQGNRGYFSSKEIRTHVKQGDICRDLKKLWKYNLIDIQIDLLGIKRTYRAKMQITGTRSKHIKGV